MCKSVPILLSSLILAAACSDDRSPGPAGCAPDDCACAGDCEPQPTSQRGLATSVVLPDGRLAIATYDATQGALVVIFQRPGAAERTTAVVARHESSGIGRWARVAREADGTLQVVWTEPQGADGGLIRWARGGERGFSAAETVSAAPASRLALRVDASDRPHLAYRDERLRAVRYATRQGNAWTITGIQGCAGEADCPRAGLEDYGQGLDLALGAAGGSTALPRVAFYDALRGDLKLAAAASDGRWTTVTLDGRSGATDTGDVGRFVSLALTPTRALGVAYFDATLGALRYIGPSGTQRVVDGGVEPLADGRSRRAIVGQFCVLDYDSQGAAHILYVDASAPGLRHARVGGDGPATITALSIPPGFSPTFDVVGGRLVGTYAAFSAGKAPDTALRLFDLPASGAVGGEQ